MQRIGIRNLMVAVSTSPIREAILRNHTRDTAYADRYGAEKIRSDQIDVSPHSPTCEITWGSGIFGQGINRDAVRPGMTSDIATRRSRWVGRVG